MRVLCNFMPDVELGQCSRPWSRQEVLRMRVSIYHIQLGRDLSCKSQKWPEMRNVELGRWRLQFVFIYSDHQNSLHRDLTD
jgi:hypothetical protein